VAMGTMDMKKLPGESRSKAAEQRLSHSLTYLSDVRRVAVDSNVEYCRHGGGDSHKPLTKAEIRVHCREAASELLGINESRRHNWAGTAHVCRS